MQQGARKIGAHRTGSYKATLREKEAGLSAIAHPERIVGLCRRDLTLLTDCGENDLAPIAAGASRRHRRRAQENYVC